MILFVFITISNDEDFNSKCTSITLAFCVINSSHICCSVVKVKQEPTDETPRSNSVTTNTSSKIKSCNNSVLLANEQKKRKSDKFIEENVDSRQTIPSKKQIPLSKKEKLSNVVCHPKNQTWIVEVSKR